MKRIALLCCILTSISAYILLVHTGCSLDLAGGTGVGNPSGHTVISIVADTGVGTEPSVNNNQYLPIRDDSLVLFASTAFIVVQKIYFILDENEKDDSVLNAYEGPLTIQDDSVILEGPFVFDALTGTSNFLFDTLTLPETKYKGMKFIIENDDSTLMEGYSIGLSGEFTYNETLRNFTIKLSNEKDIRPFLIDGPPVLISEDDSTEFRLTLNADHWLDYMDIKKDYLDNGTIAFDPVTGDLNIDKTIDANVYKDFNKTVRLNIMKSGSLEIINH